MNILYFTLIASIVFTHGRQLVSQSSWTPYEWNVMEFNFPTAQDRIQAEADGNLIPTNGVLIDVQPYYYNKNQLKVFVTLRQRVGIPYTLATVSDNKGADGPLLEPYPNYESHNSKGKLCSDIVSVFRVAINECNQMWVIDSGKTVDDVHCPPQLLLYDLNTDRLIHRYRFNSHVYTPGASVFITPIVDVRDPPPRGTCSRTMVYVADVNYHGLVVYDYTQNKAWRIESMFMYPDPNHGLHTLGGEKFILMDSIFGMATDKRNLYFHPLASATEFAVPLNIIDNRSLFEHDPENMQEAFKPLGQRSSACGASAMDSNNNLYCVTFNPVELIVWNVNKPYDCKNIKTLPINSTELQFVSGMKVIRNHYGNEELWMSSNSYQKMATGKRTFKEVNFRVVVLPLAPVNPGTTSQDLLNRLVFKA